MPDAPHLVPTPIAPLVKPGREKARSGITQRGSASASWDGKDRDLGCACEERGCFVFRIQTAAHARVRTAAAAAAGVLIDSAGYARSRTRAGAHIPRAGLDISTQSSPRGRTPAKRRPSDWKAGNNRTLRDARNLLICTMDSR